VQLFQFHFNAEFVINVPIPFTNLPLDGNHAPLLSIFGPGSGLVGGI